MNLNRERTKPMTKAEEMKALERYWAGDRRVRRVLIDRNARFILAVARKFQGRGLDLEDLYQEGAQGILQAADRFQPEKGFRFMSYAVWWIRQAMLRAIHREGTLIRLPDNFYTGPGRGAEEKEKSRKAEQKDVVHLMRTPARLDALAEATGFELTDSQPMQDQTFEERILKQRIAALVDTLPERQRFIIRFRFGLFDGPPETLREVAERMGVSHERIRQLEAEAMKSLRKKIALNPVN